MPVSVLEEASIAPFESSRLAVGTPILQVNGANAESPDGTPTKPSTYGEESDLTRSSTDTDFQTTSTNDSCLSSEIAPHLSTSLENHAHENGSSPVLIKIFPPSNKEDASATPPQRSGEASSDDEEYFEEFHLPNTGENAFVRHQSFRRKIKLTEIDAPDAERIEGLVRTGDFYRHGSIRKKIIPGEDVVLEVDEEFDPDSSGFSDSFSKNFRDIESMIETTDESISDFSHNLEFCPNQTPLCSTRVGHSRASTPNLGKETEDSGTSDVRESKDEDDLERSLEQTTMMKIKACLDYSNYSDIYNLSGRLQDILSPVEIEEVITNSERYRTVINEEVLEVLSLSISTHEISKGNETTNTDSGFSSPKPPEGGNQVPELPVPEFQDPIQPEGEELDSVPNLEVPNKLKKIPAPTINFDSSSDADLDPYLYNLSEDSENLDITKASEDKVESQKKKLTFDSSVFTTSSADEQSTEYFTSDSYNAKTETSTSSTEGGSDVSQAEEASQYFDSLPPPPEPEDLIPELSAAEEYAEERHWRNVVIGGAWRRIDMKAITPYRKCISHGGYTEDSKIPIVVMSAPLLPERTRKDYHYVMDNLFMYVLSYLEHLVSDDYILIYMAGGRNKDREPGFHWMKAAYQMIDRRLRKNLQQLLVVHPTIWARTLIALSRPFISSKFYRKLRIVYNLTELAQLVPLEQLEMPEIIKQIDFEMMIKAKKRTHANKW